MPRQRQRIVYCDCFDCRDRPEEPFLTVEQLDAATAVARQEPPPKALLIYATGFIVAEEATTNLDSCTLPHCNLLVREGNLGLLATRRANDDSGLEPGFAELAQVLGVYQDVCRQPPSDSNDAGAKLHDGLPSLAARFKGMQAALASTSASVRQLAGRLGVEVSERLCLGATILHPGEGAAEASAAAPESAAAPPAAESGAASDVTPPTGPEAVDGGDAKRGLLGSLPDAAAFAGAVASELGAAEGASGRDLLLLHLDLDDLLGGGAAAKRRSTGPDAGPGEAAAGASEATAASSAVEAEAEVRWDAACEGLEWLDSLMKGLVALKEVRERTLLVLMLSPAGRKMPPVPGQAGGVSLLQPGGASLDPAAAIVTPKSLAQVGRAGMAAAATSTAAAGAGAAGLSVLDSDDCPLVTRPVQSFELLGLGKVEVDLNTPVLVARRLPGVVRRDRAERLGYREALSAGGQGVILLDRLLPEVAYKIGRAPKYGA